MDVYHGFGKYIYTDKSTYEGGFAMGFREGRCVQYHHFHSFVEREP